MTAISDSLTHPKHELAAREIEQELGLEPVDSVLVKDRGKSRTERRPRDWEGLRGSETGIDPHEVKRKVTELWQSDTPARLEVTQDIRSLPSPPHRA